MFIGVDPGVGGGLAMIHPDGVFASPMPKTERERYDAIASFVSFATKAGTKPTAVIEFVSSSPQMGVKSAFTFGMAYGSVRMTLIACGVSFIEATPPTWMRGLGLRRKRKGESLTDWKNFLKSQAQQLYPEIKMNLKICDAILIAEYCRTIRKPF